MLSILKCIKGLNMKEGVYLLHPSKTGTNHFLKQREVNIIKKKIYQQEL